MNGNYLLEIVVFSKEVYVENDPNGIDIELNMVFYCEIVNANIFHGKVVVEDTYPLFIQVVLVQNEGINEAVTKILEITVVKEDDWLVINRMVSIILSNYTIPKDTALKA